MAGMARIYLYSVCPRCEQDYLAFAICRKTGRVFVCCGECEASWWSLEEVGDGEKMFVDLSPHLVDASYEEIVQAGLGGCISGFVDV